MWYARNSASTDATASEPGSDSGTFKITRTGSTTSSLTVKYSIAGGATNGVDYNTLSGSVVIPAGSSSVSLTVTPKDDTLVEGTESVVLTILSTADYTVGTASATVNIADNDAFYRVFREVLKAAGKR